MDLSERPTSDFRRHPWELSRGRFFTQLLREAGVLGTPRYVLDVGAGDGWFLTELIQVLPANSRGLAWDLNYEDVALAKLDLAHEPRLSFTNAEPAELFDLLLLLDVLEHIKDDAAFLAARVTRNLLPGGTALISVPTWPALFTSHDTALGHFRRYRPSELCALIETAGLEIQTCGGLFHVLTLARALSRVQELLKPATQGRTTPKRLEWHAGPLTTSLVNQVLQLDNQLSSFAARRGYRIPGLSFWALCTRPGAQGTQGPPQ